MLEQYLQTLACYERYWRFSPFACLNPPWDKQLNARLLALTAADIAELAQDSHQCLEFFSHWFPTLKVLPPMAQTKVAAAVSAFPFWLTNGIAGRKLAQIEALIANISLPEGHLVEWCAGKGHLGRLLSFSQHHEVVSIEWQQALCDVGQQLAEHYQIAQRFIQADVLRDDLGDHLQRADGAVALHACGDLHVALMRQATKHATDHLFIAPCCYHLTHAKRYIGLSQQGQQLIHQYFTEPGYTITSAHIKLVVQEQVTAGARVARLREQEVQWRLAYQGLYEWVTGAHHYRPLPSVSKHWFSGEFEEFVQWAAQYHGIVLPPHIDIERWLAHGETARLQVARLDLVRHLFRRPLEAMLVLDRATFLAEHGYQVQISEFCNYHLTPRNFLISACRA